MTKQAIVFYDYTCDTPACDAVFEINGVTARAADTEARQGGWRSGNRIGRRPTEWFCPEHSKEMGLR